LEDLSPCDLRGNGLTCHSEGVNICDVGQRPLKHTSQEPMHDSTNRAGLALNQQMHMIGHETVGVEEEW
jgi:hypothetical protein